MEFQNKVIFIHGQSFCGSTILNYILDSHPKIYGGSELYRLREKQDNFPQFAQNMPPGFCNKCGKSCPYWTENNLDKVRKTELVDFYNKIAEIMKVEYVVDSSKEMWHFKQMVQANPGLNYKLVLLTKHPIRHLSSFLYHHIFVRKLKCNDIDGIQKSWKENNGLITEYIQNKIENFTNFYQNNLKNIKKWCNENKIEFLLLKYEDLALNTEYIANEVSSHFQLEIPKKSLDFRQVEHHCIGGNAAPEIAIKSRNSKLKLSHDNKKRDDKKLSFSREYYIAKPLITMDNKFLNIMPIEGI